MTANSSTPENRTGSAAYRFFSLGLQNPVFRYGAWVLFILLVIRLSYVGFPGLPVPAADSGATNYYVAPRTITCKKPNPTLEAETAKAEEDVSPYYTVESDYLDQRKESLRQARDRLTTSLEQLRQLERQLRSMGTHRNQPEEGVRTSPFYKGRKNGETESSRKTTQSASYGRAEQEQQYKEVRKHVLGIIHTVLPNPRMQGHVAVYKALKNEPTLIPALFDAVAMTLDEIENWLVVETYDVSFDRDRARGIILVASRGVERPLKDSDRLYSYSNAIQAIRSEFRQRIVRENFPRLARNTALTRFAEELVLSSLRTNLRKNQARTERALKKTLTGISREVPVEFAQGQTIVALGETVEPWQAQCIATFASSGGKNKDMGELLGVPGATVLLLLGITLLAVLSALMLSRFALKFLRARELYDNDYLAIAVLMVLHLALVRLFLFLAGILSVSYPDLGRATLLAACPVALAPMMLNVLLRARVAILGTLFLVMMTSVVVLMSGPEMLSGNFPGYFTLYLLFVSLSGIAVTHRASRRGSYAIAGGVVAISGMTVWIMATFLEGGQVPPGHSLQLFLASIVSGALTYVLIMSLVPFFEYLWDYTTDSRLVELASTDHEALKELSREAPGTYQHSMWIATLVEDAAEAIQANSLLARVGAYYHDLGKLVAAKDRDSAASPLFFAENQSSGANPHNHLPARVSARIIKRHVAQSTYMIRKYRLGKRVYDLAEQHHGTTLLEHFYNKALMEAKETGEKVDERDFRYAGPKPQSKEAALVMLADSVEAAVRALPQHTEESIRKRISDIFDKRISDGQLDESGMTFGDVTRVKQSFIKTLSSMYHARPEYLKAKQDEKTVRLNRDELDGEEEETLEVRERSAADAPAQPGDSVTQETLRSKEVTPPQEGSQKGSDNEP